MHTYRVAVLGCRGRGTAAARAYHAHPRCEIVALCDLVPERLDTLGEELGIKARFTDLDKMMRKTSPEIVAIPTGTEFHYDLSMRMLDYGVHIDVEKPMCSTLAQADAVLKKAREKGVLIAVHHQGRVGAPMQAAMKALKEGKIGEIRHLIASCKGYYGGYGLMNIGTHLVNNLLRFAGHCRSITGVAVTDGRPVTPGDVIPAAGGMGIVCGERITATLQFARNVTATLLQHRFPVVDSIAYGIEVLGTEGRLFWKSSNAWWLPTPHFVPDGTRDRWEALPVIYPDSFDPSGTANEADYAYVDEYVRALDKNREHECSGIEGRHVMEVLMGVLEAGTYGRRVFLPQEDREHPLIRWRREHGLDEPAPMSRDYATWLAEEDRRLGRG